MKAFKQSLIVFMLCAPRFVIADIALEYSTPGRIIGINRSAGLVAVAYNSQLCLYAYEHKITQSCIELPQFPSQVKWSRNNNQISTVLTDPETSDDSVWMIDFSSKHRYLIWPVNNTGVKHRTNTVYFYEWLNDKTLVFGYHCGTECIMTEVVNVEGETRIKGRSLTLEGNLQWLPSKDRLIVKGHAGSLVTLSVQVPMPESDEHLGGCFDQAHWYRYETSLSQDEWLLSKQRCDRGALVDVGGDLYRYAPDSGQLVKLGAGSPAALATDKHRIAVLAGENDAVLLSVMDLRNQTIERRLIPGYELIDSMTDSVYDRLKPQWSPNGNFILVPMLFTDKGQLRVRGFLASFYPLTIKPITFAIKYAERIDLLSDEVLMIGGDHKIYFYRINSQ